MSYLRKIVAYPIFSGANRSVLFAIFIIWKTKLLESLFSSKEIVVLSLNSESA